MSNEEKTYTASEVKKMLATSMETFRAGMIHLIRDCSRNAHYQKMTATEALMETAKRLEGLKNGNS